MLPLRHRLDVELLDGRGRQAGQLDNLAAGDVPHQLVRLAGSIEEVERAPVARYRVRYPRLLAEPGHPAEAGDRLLPQVLPQLLERHL